ncbi:MAG TPA: hypothetical protein VLA66_14920 [Thermoanaerobaculia bacterium]|nr:hypothetical protein [Thermoanaerobaculia bacterium]
MLTRFVAACCLGLCGVAAALASDATVWDQSDVVVPSGVAPTTTFTVADDFTVPATMPAWQLVFADVWMQDGMELPLDGMLTGFVGTVGWAIYSDAAGEPGTLLASGSDPAATLLGPTVPACCWDTQRVYFRFAPAVTVTPGEYWLAIREGGWGVPAGPNEHYHAAAAATRGSSARIAPLGGVPTSFAAGGGSDLAFVVYGSAPVAELVFASGFEAGVTCAWSQTSGGDTCP